MPFSIFRLERKTAKDATGLWGFSNYRATGLGWPRSRFPKVGTYFETIFSF